jgi:hypothetical protein
MVAAGVVFSPHFNGIAVISDSGTAFAKSPKPQSCPVFGPRAGSFTCMADTKARGTE